MKIFKLLSFCLVMVFSASNVNAQDTRPTLNLEAQIALPIGIKKPVKGGSNGTVVEVPQTDKKSCSGCTVGERKACDKIVADLPNTTNVTTVEISNSSCVVHYWDEE